MVPWERTSKDACFMEKVKGDMKKDIFLLCFSVLLEKNKKDSAVHKGYCSIITKL
jgi:hypothetical protein